MVFYTSLWACIIIALVLAHHALAVLLRGLLASIFSYVNIALHLLLVLCLFYIGAELSELLLIFSGSLLFRTALEFVFARFVPGKADREEGAT